MLESVHFSGQGPVWVSIIGLLQVLLLLWFGLVILVGSWKLFRWLIKWKP
jgi:hypothetical protein